MSLVIELERDGRKAGRVCDREYRRGPGCPLIVRTTSEDVLTANVFGILRRLPPRLWLRPLLNRAYRTRAFTNRSMAGLDVAFWQPVLPPSNRAFIEGWSEVDVLVRFKETMVFIEAKYRSPLATRTTHDDSRDQLARLLDVAYQTTTAEQFFPRAPYVLVLGVSREEPALVTRYRAPEAVATALAHHSRFPDFVRMARLLASRVGYVSWSDIADVAEASVPKAGTVERLFLADVTRYVRHKVSTAALTNAQRQQMALRAIDDRPSPDEP